MKFEEINCPTIKKKHKFQLKKYKFQRGGRAMC